MPKTTALVGVVVTFYPKDDLIKNISTYIDHVDRLLIFDNSEVAEVEFQKSLVSVYGDRIRIESYQTNYGIAAALNRASEWGKSENKKWLLTMDQDSSFEDSTFFDEFSKYDRKDTVAIFSPNQLLKVNNSYDSSQVINETIVMTSGNIINLSVHTKIGGFDEKLFIDEVDHDYCLRAKLHGYQILKFLNIRLKHNLGVPLNKFRRDKTIINQHSPIRFYYISRNNFYIFSRYFLNYPKLVCKRVINFIVLLREVVLHQDQKSLKLKYVSKGFFHFLIGRYGKL